MYERIDFDIILKTGGILFGSQGKLTYQPGFHYFGNPERRKTAIRLLKALIYEEENENSQEDVGE